MGKRNKNKHRKLDVENTPASAEETAAEQPVDTQEPVEEQEPTDEGTGTVEEVIAQALEAPAAEAEPKAEEVPQPKEEEAPPPPGPAPVETKQFKIPTRKVMADELLPSRLSPMQKCVMSPNQLHTPAGLKLLEMFKEYEAAMSVRTTDRAEHAKRARMLSNIVQQTCPFKLKNTQVGKDLVMIFFDQLMKGWGTIYTDSSIFRLDYSLGNPAVIDKMDIFVQAMIQLVEAATGNADHIAFQNDRLAKIIDSPSVMTAIENLRIGIEKRLAQQKK